MSARLTIEYDGSEFGGWARQPGVRTVQDTLEDALATVLRREVALAVAGRTDRGVHARGQVASHHGEPASAESLNGVLPGDVREAYERYNQGDGGRMVIDAEYLEIVARKRG